MRSEPFQGDSQQPDVGRRRVLGLGSAMALGVLFSGAGAAAAAPARAAKPALQPTLSSLTAHQKAALDALGRTSLRAPGSLPFPALPAGTDTLPGIDHIVVLMLENHSFDNIFGMLGRGDGFTLDSAGKPTATNPYGWPDVRTQHAFPMPTSCQTGQVTQSWHASHTQYNDGAMDGFVAGPASMSAGWNSGPVAMGYFDDGHLPFTYSLARQFPIGDRWFCSLLGPTSPNRRFTIGATAAGMTNDPSQDASNRQTWVLAAPTGPTIFNRLDDHGISWADYYVDFPLGATPEEFPWVDTVTELIHRRAWTQFFTDAAAGTLPSFVFLDEAMNQSQSEEEVDQHPPFFMGYGDDLLSQVVHALASSPQWPSTMLIVCYDEHGGYFDHVPPPPALAPDGIAPVLDADDTAFDGYTRYGFRVPSIVVSPYAKKDHVSHLLYDHTSILAMIERKWNLAALTWRDANANDLTDFLDLDALAARTPTFPALPPLTAPGMSPEAKACMTTGPGTIPAPGSVSYGSAGPMQWSSPQDPESPDTSWGTFVEERASFYQAHPTNSPVDLDSLRNAQRAAVTRRPQKWGNGLYANTFYLFTGADGAEYLQVEVNDQSTPGFLRGFQPLPGNAGAPFFAAPRTALTAMPNNDAQIIAVGLDQRLYHTIYYTGTDTFQPWGPLNWGASDASIAATATGDVQVVGIGLDGNLYHNIRAANGAWTGFAATARNGLASGPIQRAAIAVDSLSSDAHVVALDSQGSLCLTTRHVAGNWSSPVGANTWTLIADKATHSEEIADIAVAVPAAGPLHIGITTASGKAFEQHLDPATGNSSAPATLPSTAPVQSISLKADYGVTVFTVQKG
ncbi:alkaline phosphatase family protein [Streptomyces sp. NPDC001817]|uniref:alkaline phosphatase family protein n=1 Tax=Streptomyces sp. NPDC001817 TaxID=3154398 RepID=UPI003324A77B